MAKVQCPHCRGNTTFYIGEESWLTYYHCTCGHDFQIDKREYAWTSKEIDEANKLPIKGKDPTI